MAHLEPALGQTLARALALAGDADPPFVVEERRFEGYGWYDALDRVTEVRLLVTRVGTLHIVRDEDRPDFDHGPAERLAIEVEICDAGGTKRIETYPADVAVVTTDDYGGVMETIALLIGPAPKIGVPALVGLLVDAAFYPSDDSGSDSYDTQLDYVEREALQLARTHLIGVDAGIVGRAVDRVKDRICWLVPDGRRLLITVTRDGADAAFEDAPPTTIDESSFFAAIEVPTRDDPDDLPTARAALGAVRALCAARRRDLAIHPRVGAAGKGGGGEA